MVRQLRTCWTAAIAAAWLCAAALGQAVEFQPAPREGWVGSPITVEVIASTSEAEPQPPEIAESADFAAEVVGVPQRMEVRKIINGSVQRRSTTTWSVQFTPKRAGVLELPRIKIVADGRTYQSPPQKISIAPADSGDVLAVSVQTHPSALFAGQAATLVLKIAVRPYVNREYDIAMSERQMWDLIDKAASSWGVFEPRLRELFQNNQRPAGREELRDGEKWFVYEIACAVNVGRSGPLDLGDVRIELKYPTGITMKRDFFGATEPWVNGIRKVSKSPDESKAIVQSLPAAGQPASFRGAVGDFEISASVKPTKAAVGDPMTLTLSIHSLSENAEELRTLQPPPLDSAALTQRFRMPADPLAGSVAGSTKVFTQTIRPLSAEVKEIPPIEFSYFNPATARYATVKTQPIPIQVSPAERINSAAIEGLASGKKDAPKTTLTAVDGGLFANALPGPDLLISQKLEIGWGVGLTFAVPPVLAMAALVAQRRRHAAQRNRGTARARGAARDARRRLDAAGDAATIARAIQGYIEARTGRAEGTVARADAVALAREAGADDETSRRLDEVLALGERAAFAPQRDGDPRQPRERATQLLAALDRLAWRRRAEFILEEIQP